MMIVVMADYSLISSIITLSQFLRDNFPNISWFPYWYLGAPVYYLTGPLVPLLLNILSKLSINYIAGYFLLIFLSIIFTGVGIYGLSRNLAVSKKHSIISAMFYVLFPAIYWVLGFQNGLKHIVLLFVPLIIVLYKKYLFRDRLSIRFLLVAILTVMILINSSSLITILIIFSALLLSADAINREKYFIKSTLLVSLAISISTLWYTPGYWWTLATNPSVGGLPVVKLAVNIIKGLVQFLPVAVAVFMVKTQKKSIASKQKFIFIYLISFIFLTFIRFILDFDFIMDWTGFIPEIQLGAALLIGSNLDKLKRFKYLVFVLTIIILTSSIYLLGNKAAQFSADKNLSNDYKVRIRQVLAKYVPGDKRVFLSGSSVFWVNEYLPLLQVRGGNDLASTHYWWAHGAYQIREGKNAKLTYSWLRILGASYILVHSDKSGDPFHDFKNIDKFNNKKLFILKYQGKGDYLYVLKDTDLARVADKNILDIPTPRNGADQKSIYAYEKSLKRTINYSSSRANEFILPATTKSNEVISLAVAYDPRWKLAQGKGVVFADSFGNMVIVPNVDGYQKYVLSYQKNVLDWLVPCVFIIFLAIFYRKSERILFLSRKFSSRLSIGISENENDY